jgi:hypothetical protein
MRKSPLSDGPQIPIVVRRVRDFCIRGRVTGGRPDDSSEALTEENRMIRKVDRGIRPDHWIYLDRSWAHRLGVMRAAGTYRIRSRELARRLAQETLWVDESGIVHVRAATSSNTAAGRNGNHPEGFPARARPCS